MESSSGDLREGTEETPGSKKSKLKSLRTRLFRKSKRAGEERHTKLSQSASDITAGEGLGSDEDLSCSHGVMGSRALSHDSIFLDDEILTDAEPARVLSQENVHSKIKALQIKLQQQKMHLGPPPLVLPIRRPEDLGSHLEDSGLPSRSPEVTGSDVTSQGVFSKNTSQPSSLPLSPILIPALAKYVAPHPSAASVTEPTLDFSSPPQFTPCLDTSAARHRMSVKPRNQRASTKKRVATTGSRLPSYTPNNTDHSESVTEEDQLHCAQDNVTQETDQGEADIPIIAPNVPSKFPEVEPVASEAANKLSSLIFSQQEPVPPHRAPPSSSQLLRPKPQRSVDVSSSERPHSSFAESELQSRREAGFEIQVMSYEKRNMLKKTGMTEDSSDKLSTVSSSTEAFRPSTVHQQVQEETETTKSIKRPGSGSFYFSITTAKNRDGARPRSSSFGVIREQAEAKHGGREDKSSSSLREKEELIDLQPRGSPCAVGRLKQEGAPPKSLVLQWERRGSLKNIETTSSAFKNEAGDTGSLAREEVEKGQREVKRSQEEVAEAVEAQEEVQEKEGKMAFGIKLRSTSQSRRYRRDAAPNHLTKLPVCEDQCDKQKKQEVNEHVGHTSQKPPTSISSSPSISAEGRVTEPTPFGFSLPVRNNQLCPGDSHIMPAEVRATSSDHKEAETVLTEPQPQAASSEVSWMSLAMEKTRSLQQLFTSRFPRDLASVQTATRPQAPAQPTNQTEPKTGVQTQKQSSTALQSANPPSTDWVKATTVQNSSQMAKPSQVSVHQKTSMRSGLSKAFTEAQTSKQTSESQSHLNATQCPAHLSESSSHQSDLAFGQHATAQQPPWSNQVLQQTSQPKSTISVSTTLSVTAAPLPPGGEKEGSMEEKEAPSPAERRAVWGESVSKRAAFLEKRAERTTLTVTNEVDLKKVPTEMQTLDESPASAKSTPVSTDTKPEGRQGLKPAESTSTKVPDRPREDKWIRKNVDTLSPSSPHTQSTVLQSMSSSGQPSWMELAKRKSMAWSDKTMD